MSVPGTVEPGVGRIRAFDLARGLAVLFMMLIHVLGHYGDPATWRTLVGAVIVFLGGPLAAPVFMFLMGASLALSRRSNALAIAQRGLWLLGLAYGLNVLRGALPASLGLVTGVIDEADIAPYSVGTLLALVDIHQLAGLSLLLIAALPAIRAVPLAALALAIGVAILAPLMWGTTSGIAPIDAALRLLWGAEWYVFFPLLGWFAYPLVGLAYGTLLVRTPDRRAFVRRAGRIGVAVGLAGLALMLALDPVRSVDDYWRQGPATVAAIVGLGMAWLAACDIAVERIPPNRVLDLLYGWSARVTSMYCIHWILIGWGVGIVGHRTLDLPAIVVATIVVILLTDRLTKAHPRLIGSTDRVAVRTTEASA
jgi:uncharacterized membrane protein